MHKSQNLFNLTAATTASGNRYTVIELNLLIKNTDRLD
jgi:hypothetical protein